MKIELVSGDQMALLQWCLKVYKGFCSFPILKKIDFESLGFALFEFNYILYARVFIFWGRPESP
jgi:hypothetical protein